MESLGVALGFQMGQGGWVGGEDLHFITIFAFTAPNSGMLCISQRPPPAPAARARPPNIRFSGFSIFGEVSQSC